MVSSGGMGIKNPNYLSLRWFFAGAGDMFNPSENKPPAGSSSGSGSGSGSGSSSSSSSGPGSGSGSSSGSSSNQKMK